MCAKYADTEEAGVKPGGDSHIRPASLTPGGAGPKDEGPPKSQGSPVELLRTTPSTIQGDATGATNAVLHFLAATL